MPFSVSKFVADLAEVSDESLRLARSCAVAPTLRPAFARRVAACRERVAELEHELRNVAPQERAEIRAMLGTAKFDLDFAERDSHLMSTRLMRALQRRP